MVGRKTSVINGREFAILKLIWEHGPLTVRQIREHLTTDDEIPYTSVLTLVQLMEEKEFLRHKREGKTYRYSARKTRKTMTRTLLRDFIARFFDGSPEALVMGLAESSQLDPEIWDELQAEVRKRKKEKRDE
jgi:predicted transcriptional regulator